MVKIAIVGAMGRMGRLIAALGHDAADIVVTGALEAAGSTYIGEDYGLHIAGKKSGVIVTDDIEKGMSGCDVVIDFASAKTTGIVCAAAAAAGKGIVIGVTGLEDAHLAAVKKSAVFVPCVQAPNMSMGMNYLFKIVKEAAAFFPDAYDIEIEERHHNRKKDAPSGTANKFAELIAEAKGWDLKETAVYGRQGIVGERGKNEMGIFATRGGDIVGDHTVLFAGPGECIEFTHKAVSRNTFASGALEAARFVSRARPGLYTMADVFGL